MTEALNRRQFIENAAAAALLAGWSTAGLSARSRGSRIADLVERERAGANLTGLGAAVVSSKGLEAVAVSGKRVWPSGPVIQLQDRWHLGSCTKAITATLAARLIAQRRIRWDSTVGEILKLEMAPDWRDVPLLWLVSHRSGASMNFDQELWERMVARGGPLADQRRFFASEGLKLPPEAKPNTKTIYSNAGFMIAGAMMEAATGLPWEELVRREVFAPLGMTRSGFGPPGSGQPRGHNRDAKGGWQPAPNGSTADNPAATGPAGTVHCSLQDWARFIAAHLRGFKGQGRYLSQSAWQQLHRAGGPDWDFTPGWKVDHDAPKTDPALQHLGSNGFWLSQATLFPARDRAVLIVANVADDAAEPVFGRILKSLSGRT